MIEIKAGYASIFLKEMEVCVAIGLEAFEKQAPQRLVISVALFVDAKDYLNNINAQTIVDYAALHDVVKGWESKGHVELIETYVQELIPVCFAWPQVEACRISIGKPDIFDAADQVGVEVFLDRETFQSL